MTYTADTSVRYRGSRSLWAALALVSWAAVARADSPADDRPVEPRLRARVGAGAGVAERRVNLPASSGERVLRTGGFPAADLMLQFKGRLRGRFSLSADAHYQTSVGLTAAQTFADRGAETRAGLRSHHLELGLAPGYGSGPRSLSLDLRFFVGWWMRGLRPVSDLELPAYTLQGPALRPELQLGFFQRRVVLRVAPELLVVAIQTGALRSSSRTSRTGYGVGGEISLDIELVPLVSLLFAFRESHVFVHSRYDAQVDDTERFVTASLVLRL